MVKLIYSLKIYLFRSQFHLSPREMTGIQELNVFVVRLYLKAWFTCTVPASAPRNDLQLIKNLVSYSAVNKHVANSTTKSFMRHLWYLNEQLIGLAFFDASLSIEEKAELVSALSTESNEEVPPSRVTMTESDVTQGMLSHFVT